LQEVGGKEIMQLKPITAIIVLFLVVASLSTAGCMSNTSSPSSTPTSQVKQYADAWHKSIQDGLGPNETLTVWKEKENGSDTVRLQWTVVNSTTSGFDSNGTTTTYSVNVKQFANTDDATAFYDDTSFGYAPSTTVNATLIKPEDNIYQQVTGKNVTVLNGAWKLDSFTFVTMRASFVVQQNEFVVWGAASVMPNSSTATTTSTPTQVPSVVSTPTVTPTAKPLQCYHVDFIIYHNTSIPCNTCAQTLGTLQPRYANNSYWSGHIENINDNGTGNRMVGIVRETGETTTFAWGDITAIEAWSDAHLLCY
jgi:hypothetical protein